MEFFWYGLFTSLCVLVVLAGWRFLRVRATGCGILLRRLPAVGVHGWRHGALRYSGDGLEFYKLRSVSPSADLRFPRTGAEVTERREPTVAEMTFMPAGVRIIELSVLDDRYELALDGHGETALTSWIESAPSARQERRFRPLDR
ncbi:DUF2550 domain-containing protein [Corynebacterium sp. TAE3-ERU16]|uniref:DUF2550 domain-containing protein n=1 Tax=Corynebacterium sp. TAE3-ERU16 TaxID=2849493 RepID=UPI001C453017|nr:DUF2550 domain-containing protein [Corynebacterium sp. TAE3-ERU16]MBV7412911.1 DUF2550 domain-containing protein [Dermabacteraceae bacterium TAE3-ERU27]